MLGIACEGLRVWSPTNDDNDDEQNQDTMVDGTVWEGLDLR